MGVDVDGAEDVVHALAVNGEFRRAVGVGDADGVAVLFEGKGPLGVGGDVASAALSPTGMDFDAVNGVDSPFVVLGIKLGRNKFVEIEVLSFEDAVPESWGKLLRGLALARRLVTAPLMSNI